MLLAGCRLKWLINLRGEDTHVDFTTGMKVYQHIFLFLLTGCSSAYIPSPKNIPLFEKKGEVQIEACASTNSIFATGSFAFSEKYALIANGSMAYCYILGRPIRSYNELTIFLDGDVPHRSVELGLGRYNLSLLPEWRLEIFAGTGYGAAHSFFGNDNKQHYYQGFMQLNTGKKYKHAEIGWSYRMVYSGFYFKNGYYRDPHSGEYIFGNGNYQALHLEPLFVVRTGGQRLKVSFRAGLNLAYPVSSSSKSANFEHTLLHLSAGLRYRF